MKQESLKRGLVTLCIGGGQRIALALESLWRETKRRARTRLFRKRPHSHGAALV